MAPLGLIDLASARVGGRALVASDEFFAPKENLLAPGRGVFIEGKYTDRGKWMDGWETRRRRGGGPEGAYDWCVIRLGIPGAIRALTVDTNPFRGNHPAACSLDAATRSARPSLRSRAPCSRGCGSEATAGNGGRRWSCWRRSNF